MKVVTTNDSESKTKATRLLPLVPSELEPLTKENSVGLLLATDPANMADSPKYKMLARILKGDEDVRTMLVWKESVKKVIRGMNLNTAMLQAGMIPNLLDGTAKVLYEAKLLLLTANRREATAAAAQAAQGAAQGAGDAIRAQPLRDHYHVDDIQESIQHMLEQSMPRRVLSRVKRYLRRECRKPADMKVKIYLNHLIRINRNELDELPPFHNDQRLSDDELLDIILFGTPKAWQKEMDRQGYDPLVHPLNHVVGFMEQIEASEDFDANKKTNDKSKDKSNGNGKKVSFQAKGKGGSKTCLYHGQCAHASEDCTVLKDLAKKKKAKSEDSSGGSYNNNNWKKKSSYDASKVKKELAAFVNKAVAEGVKKQLKGKRKANSSDDDREIAALQNVLDDFNYEDMDKLNLESDSGSESGEDHDDESKISC